MITISSSLKLILSLSKVQTLIHRKFDARLGHSLGFNDFVILYYLSQANGEKLRRVDLAEKIGFTASGVTRMLAPMEKIGLVARETNVRDARVSYVVLAPGGKRLLDESLETAHYIANEIFPRSGAKKLENLAAVLNEFTGIL